MTMGQNPALTTDENRAIIELRKKTNWVKGAKGRFAGSVPMGGGSGEKGSIDLTKSETSSIIKLRVNLFEKTDPIYLDAFSIEEEDGFEDVCVFTVTLNQFREL